MTAPSEAGEPALRAAISAARRRATGRVEDLSRQFATIVEATAIGPTDDEHDPEGATIAFERAQVVALLAAARSLLSELDRAEERLDAGTYGRCASCGAEVGVERLLARPTAQRCVRCEATHRGPAGGASIRRWRMPHNG